MIPTWRRHVPGAALLLIAMALTACGGGAGAGPTPAAITVTAVNFEFQPNTITVAPGTAVSITFVNSGTVTHSFTAASVGVDQETAAGTSDSLSFAAPRQTGTFEFHCTFHTRMKGVITIAAPATATPQPPSDVKR